MTTLNAITTGLLRTARFPGVVIGLWLVNLAVALPAAWIVSLAIQDSVGSSLVHEKLRAGFDMGWYGDFEAYAEGLAATFTPHVAGVGAFLDNLEGWATGELFVRLPVLVVLAGAYALLWALLMGGVVDRYAHPDEPRSIRRFFSSGGRFFFRFVRLALFSAVLYAAVYLGHRRLYAEIGEIVRDVTAERIVLAYALTTVMATAVLLTVIHVCFTYAKIATVIEDRRSMLLAALRGVTFVVVHPFRTFGLYFGIALISLVLLGTYAFIDPGVGQSTVTGVVVAFAIAQAFLIARLFLRLSAVGGAAALYRAITAEGMPVAARNEQPVSPANAKDVAAEIEPSTIDPQRQ